MMRPLERLKTAGFLSPPREKKNAQHWIAECQIKTPSAGTLCANLSGGNQQKVIVARELARPVKLLIVNQPTRGLDVGSIEFIHNFVYINCFPTTTSYCILTPSFVI
jgi:ABC-type uncharacterized transport system ATPase subunit